MRAFFPRLPVRAAMARAQGLLFAFLAYASWGLLSPLGKELLAWFTPMWLNAVRFLIATALLLVALGPRAAHGSLLAALRWPVLSANLLANLSLTLFALSLPLLPATHATLGFYTAPLWTAALAAGLLGERVGPAFGWAVAGMLAGGYLTLFGLAGPGAVDGLGMALAVGSAVVWGLYSVRLRQAAAATPLKHLMGASFLLGSAWFLAAALLAEGLPAPVRDAGAWSWMALYVAVPSLASFLLFNAALKHAPAGDVNLFVGAELGFTAIFAALFGERLGPAQVAGLVLVLGSVTAYLLLEARRAGLAARATLPPPP
jgi:probable blue pigment (indigoidine) exporter